MRRLTSSVFYSALARKYEPFGISDTEDIAYLCIRLHKSTELTCLIGGPTKASGIEVFDKLSETREGVYVFEADWLSLHLFLHDDIISELDRKMDIEVVY
jgi:hypothetical protein